jgi:Right handed beta helix region
VHLVVRSTKSKEGSSVRNLFMVTILLFAQYELALGSNERITKLTGPIEIGSSSVLRNFSITSLKGPCIVVAKNAFNVLVESGNIGPCGTDQREDYGVYVSPGARGVVIRNNKVHSVSTGVRATSAVNPIDVIGNVFFNIRGPLWSGQAIQFNDVKGGVRGSQISCNISDALDGIGRKSYEDHISMYKTYGLPGSPIVISKNKIRGGTSVSGGGITVGDKGGGWIVVSENIVSRVANSGIGVAGGEHIYVMDNTIDNRGEAPSSLTHMALYVRAFSQCRDIQIKRNRTIARLWIWGERDGRLDKGFRHGPELCEEVHIDGNTFGDESIHGDIFNLPSDGCER